MADKQYIEREVLIDKIFPIGLIDDGRYAISAKAVKTAIDKAPTADVAPVVHGEWVDIFSLDNNENVIATCNYCKERGKVRTARNEWGVWYINSPRCPNCGAKMDKENLDG